MRRRILLKAQKLIASRGYGRFLGNDFYMTSEKHAPVVAKGLHPAVSEEVPSIRYARHSTPAKLAFEWAISLAPYLKEKKVSPEAKEYIHKFILDEMNNLKADDVLALYNAMDDLKIISTDVIAKFMQKIRELYAAGSMNKDSLADICIQLLSRTPKDIHIDDEDREYCIGILHNMMSAVSRETQYRIAALYTDLLPKCFISLGQVEQLIMSIIGVKHGSSSGICMKGCAESLTLMGLLKSYILHKGSEWKTSLIGETVDDYLNNTLFVDLQSKINLLKASQATSVLRFLSETGIRTEVLSTKLLCDRYVRDISQFSLSDIFEFNKALLTMGYVDDRVILRTLTYLPRRHQALDSVEQLITLLHIVKAANYDSEYFRTFVAEKVMSLAYKIGRMHCNELSSHITPKICNKASIDAVESIKTTYSLTSL
ncbi:hypothetical protein BgAZ_207880 [Babesia gibsoni]|uniref:Uncharacterized protein n=1 Tax=Babesia gibsoni TaxID=33632 RepID=A0AAD8PEL1_BABGI|nr:hypothetical protein BgAZ_207880 [Babesia gibsoni]